MVILINPTEDHVYLRRQSDGKADRHHESHEEEGCPSSSARWRDCDRAIVSLMKTAFHHHQFDGTNRCLRHHSHEEEGCHHRHSDEGVPPVTITSTENHVYLRRQSDEEAFVVISPMKERLTAIVVRPMEGLPSITISSTDKPLPSSSV